jgi:hypothetical protein
MIENTVADITWAKRLADDPARRKKLFKGLPDGDLLDLAVLHFAYFYDDHKEPAFGIRKRLFAKGERDSHFSIVQELTPPMLLGFWVQTVRKKG